MMEISKWASDAVMMSMMMDPQKDYEYGFRGDNDGVGMVAYKAVRAHTANRQSTEGV